MKKKFYILMSMFRIRVNPLTLFKIILVCFLIASIIPSVIFFMTFSRENSPCGLINNSNVCWANSSIQILCSSEKLSEFIRKQLKHKDIKIRALATIFTRYERKFVFDASFLYRILFEEPNKMVIGQPQKVQEALEILLSLITKKFPGENFFPDKKMNEELLKCDNSAIIRCLRGKKQDEVLTEFIKRGNFLKTRPKGICFNVMCPKKNSQIILPEFSIKNLRYELTAVLVECENVKRHINGVMFHSYALLNRKKTWFTADDDKIDEIEEKDSQKIFQNKNVKFAFYTLVE